MWIVIDKNNYSHAHSHFPILTEKGSIGDGKWKAEQRERNEQFGRRRQSHRKQEIEETKCFSMSSLPYFERK